jgi:nitroreductase
VLAWSHAVVDESADLRSDIRGLQSEKDVGKLIARRSVSPKRLDAPGPDADQIDMMLQAALCAPDHGGLHPWRVIEFRDAQRPALADLFEQEKQRRDPLVSPADLRRAREHATRAPVLLAFVVSPSPRSKVPVREQWLAAGAALCNLMNAAHQLGYGAIVLSGERCFDRVLASELGLRASELLAGFISIGTAVEAPPARRQVQPGQVWSRWTPGLKVRPHSADEQTRSE